MRLCDYCPNTTFEGDVCPTCGYDYADVKDYSQAEGGTMNATWVTGSGNTFRVEAARPDRAGWTFIETEGGAVALVPEKELVRD